MTAALFGVRRIRGRTGRNALYADLKGLLQAITLARYGSCPKGRLRPLGGGMADSAPNPP
jgi:hypothetical protein